MKRVMCAGVAAALWLAVGAPAARADVAPSKTTKLRNGPGRSCGSGAGLGLAGIGATWGLCWLGTRSSRRQK